MSDTFASIVPSGLPPTPAQPFPGMFLQPPQPALGPSVVIKFFTEVNPVTAQQLMQTLDTCVRQGVTEVLLLISSSGGSVHHGVSLYNWIRALPITVTTHNFGSVDSIALVLFAAGKRRLSVPHARFLLHGVTTGLPTVPGQMLQLGEDAMLLLLKNLRADQTNIAKIIAANSNRSESQIRSTMRAQTIVAPDALLKWNLVHGIADVKYPDAATLLAIQ
jgi:ATP-dependent Clp protease, protease subunit